MKLSRNVLVGSLAVSGMVLGAVAPAMTAQAATTSGQFGTDGKLTQVDPTTKADNLADADHNITTPDALAIAYDKGDGSAYGIATAGSNVNVKVVSGLLTLDAVPDFGFGSGASGSTVALQSNKADGAAVDGNNEGVLQVTDSRAAQADDAATKVKAGDTTGFQLSATLGGFSTTDAPAPTDETLLNKFELTLNPEEVVGGDGNNASTSTVASDKLQTSEAKLTSDGKTLTPVLTPAAGSYKVGTLKTSYTSANKGAQLAIPSGLTKNDASNPSVQSYKSVITWTLNAAPKAIA